MRICPCDFIISPWLGFVAFSEQLRAKKPKVDLRAF